MKRRFWGVGTGLALAAALSVSPVFADVIDAASVITQAIVYPSSARITRTARITVPQGLQTVRLGDLKPGFDENSIAVTGRGDVSVKILGAGLQTEFLKEAPDERVRSLEAKILAVDDALAALQHEALALEQKKLFLDSVRVFAGTQLPRDMVTKVPSAEELRATMAFLEEGIRSYGDASQALAIRQRDKDQERQALQNELNQLRSGSGRQQRVLDVSLDCAGPAALVLDVSYTVPQVSWYPLYDARVESANGKVVLGAFAVVRQTTGEDWRDVALTLSTAKPAVGGRMPEIAPWYLRPYESRTYSGMETDGMVSSRRGTGLSKAMLNMAVAAGEAAPSAPLPVERAVEVSYAQAQSSATAVVYKVAGPATVKSDGSDTRVPLMAETLDAVFEYAATPKLSTYAYLKTRVANNPENQLLAGRVNVFLDGTYVGNAAISKTVAPAETFDLYLGVDEGVSVRRQLLEHKTDDTLIGNIPSSTRKTSFSYKITIETYKKRAVTVNLFDQVPVAQDDKIKVVKVQTTIKPDTEKYKDLEGVYMWALVLAPGDKKDITISYVVEAPRDMNIEGL